MLRVLSGGDDCKEGREKRGMEIYELTRKFFTWD